MQFQDANGQTCQGQAAIDKKYEAWKKDFERAKPGSKRPPRHVAHMILVGQHREHRRERTQGTGRCASSAARAPERARVRLHPGTAPRHRQAHVHVAINNYNQLEKKQKLRLNPPELFALRMAFANKLNELGIEQSATLRRDDWPHTLDAVEKGMEKLGQRQDWYKAKMRQAAPDLDALSHRREAAKKIVALKAEIKEATLPFSSMRKEASPSCASWIKP